MEKKIRKTKILCIRPFPVNSVYIITAHVVTYVQRLYLNGRLVTPIDGFLDNTNDYVLLSINFKNALLQTIVKLQILRLGYFLF